MPLFDKNITITYKPGPLDISCLCCNYYCIEGLTPAEVCAITGLRDAQHLNFTEANEKYWARDGRITGDEFDVEAMISYSLNGWTYLIWRLGWREHCRWLFDILLKAAAKRLNYFYVDPWTGDYHWTLADNGTFYRQFDYDGSEITTNEGAPSEAEQAFLINHYESRQLSVEEWVAGRKNPFITMERVFTEVVKNSGQHIEELNRHTSPESIFITGTIRVLKNLV
jgi:hypothetical protein